MFKRLTALYVFITAMVLVLGISAMAYAETAAFTPCANALDGARYRHTAVKLPSGKVLIAGGDSESAPTPSTATAIYSSCFMYDPDTNTFTQVASLNIARTLHCAVALPDGRIMVAGGFNGVNDLSSCEIYDATSNRWTIAAYLGQSRSRFTLTPLYTGYILAAGGYSGGQAIANCELYDVTSETWANTVALSSARYFHAAIPMLNGKVLVSGGNRSETSPNETWQIYSPPLTGIAATWTPPATLPFSFDSSFQVMSGLLDNGDIIIGASNSGGRGLRFNGAAWSQGGTMQSRWGGTQIRMATNNVALIGGWGNATVVDIYLPSSNSWNSFSSIYPHTFGPAVLLNNGNILLCAGNSSGNSELLIPSTVAKPSSVILNINSPYGTPIPWSVNAVSIGTTYTAKMTNTSFSYGGRTYTCNGYTGTGSAPSGGDFSSTFTIERDSTMTWNWLVTGGTYRLNVDSAHGSPTPLVGQNIIAAGSTVNASVNAMVDTGAGIRYICIGWIGQGSVPSTGTTNAVVFELHMNSSLTWVWSTEYRIIVTNDIGLGNPNPPVGNNWFTANTIVNGMITSPVGGYQLAGYEGTGSLANDILPFFSIVLDRPTTIVWKWMPLGQNKVSLAVNTSYGTPTPSGVRVYDQGTLISASVPAYIEISGTRHDCTGWSGGGSAPATGYTNVANFYIEMNSIINWNWSTRHLLTIINSGDLGNPIPPSGSYWYTEGSPISASVTSPSGNYFCTGYTGTGNLTGSPATVLGFNITKPTTITWNWVPITLVNTQLLVNSDYGNPTPLIGTSFYFSGAVINAFIERTVIGIPGELFMCTGWTGQGSVGFLATNPETGQTYFRQSGTEINITFTILNVDANNIPYTNVLTWNWERRFYLTVFNQAGMPRSIPADGISTIVANTTVAASVPAFGEIESGLRAYCIGFTGSGSTPASGTANTVNITMTMPSTITWLWELRYQVVIDNPAGFGTPNPPAGTYWVRPGESFAGMTSTFYLNHKNQGYVLDVNGQETVYTTNTFNITVNAPTTIIWSWDYIPYKWYDPINVTMGETEIPFYLDIERSPLTSSPWICYQDIVNKDLRVVYFATNEWVNQALDSFGDVGAFCNLKIDSEGTIRIAYFDETNRTLKVAERVRGVWNIVVVDSNEGSGRYCSINFSKGGKWGVAYLDNSDLARPKIKYAEKFQNDYLVEIVHEFTGVIEYLSLLYYDEQPIIVYYDATTGKLRYLFYDAEWINDTIDGTPDVGRYCFAAINPISNQPAVVYYDLTNNRLKFAERNTDYTWQYQIVDDSGDVGFHPNLSFDAQGKARITYQDIGRQRLKFAAYDGILWQTSVLTINTNSGWMPALADYKGTELSVIYVESNKIKYISSKPLPTPEEIEASRRSGGGCFIATAAFGNMSNAGIVALTNLRDTNVSVGLTGSSLISLYYSVSPCIANSESNSPALQGMVRTLLKPLCR